MTTYAKLDPTWKKLWVDGLRSGDYKQGRSALDYINTLGEEKVCALGVVANEGVKQKLFTRVKTKGSGRFGFRRRYAPEEPGTAKPTLSMRMMLFPNSEFGDRQRAIEKIIDLNDCWGYSFNEIADWIEANL